MKALRSVQEPVKPCPNDLICLSSKIFIGTRLGLVEEPSTERAVCRVVGHAPGDCRPKLGIYVLVCRLVQDICGVMWRQTAAAFERPRSPGRRHRGV